MTMTFDEFADFLIEEKAKILDWGKAEAQKLKGEYSAGDFRQDLAQVWIDYYDTLIELTDEITRKDGSGQYVYDSNAVKSALKIENDVIEDENTASGLIHMLLALIKNQPHSSLVRHYDSLAWTLRTERRANTFIIEEL